MVCGGEAPEVAARRDDAAPLTIKSAISAEERESKLDRLAQIVASGTQVDLVCRCYPLMYHAQGIARALRKRALAIGERAVNPGERRRR